MEENLIEIFNVKTVVVQGHYRWLGKAKLPGYPRGRTMAIFELNGEYIAIPNSCPHEGGELVYGTISHNCEIICPLHYNLYSLKTGQIPSYKVLLKDEKMYIVRDLV